MYLKNELYALIQSDESIFDFIQNSSLDGLWYWDLENPENAWMNTKFWTVLGYNPDEMPHKSSAWQSIINQDDLKVANENFIKHCEDPSFPYDQLVRYTHKDGSTKWIRCRGLAIRNSVGKPIRMLGAHQNLTELKISEQELIKASEKVLESEEKYRAFYNNAPLAYQSLDENGCFIDINPMWLRTLGYERDEVIGEWFGDFLHPDYLEHFRIKFPAFKKLGLVSDVQFKLRRKDNTYIYVSFEGNVTYTPDGKFKQTYCVFKDITEQKTLENDIIKVKENAERNELELLKAQRIAHVGSWYLNVETNEVVWTEELYRMYGFDPTIPPPPYTEHMKLFTPESWEILSTSLAKTRESGIPYELELRTVKEDGANGWMWVRGEAVKDKNNTIIGLWGAAQDITERKQAELELAEVAERFKSLHNASFGGIAIHDKGIILECNHGLSEMTGYSLCELIGMDGLLLIAKESREMVMNKIVTAYEKPYEAIGLRKNGEQFPLQLEARNVPFKGKNVRTVEFRDITERKQADEALRKSEAIKNTIVSNIGDVIVIFDQNGIIKYKSPNVTKLFGYKPEELIGKSHWKNIHPDDLETGQRFLGAITTEPNATGTTEMRYKRNDGDYVWIEISVVNLLHDKDIQGLLGNFRDISKRKLAEDKAHQKDIEFRKLSSNLPDLIYQFTRRPDGSYCVPIASEGIKNIFGCSPEDVIDDFTPIAKVIYPEDAEKVINDIEYSAEHLTNFTCEFRVQIPGKPLQWILSRSTPEMQTDGSIKWYGFNANITERKHAEIELTNAKEKAEESDRLKSAFLSNMSHEIRTPMNGILGFANLLKEPNLTGEQQQSYIKIIEKSGARMLNIINDIVDISKIESGIIDINLSETNINNQFQFVYDSLKFDADNKKLNLSFNCALPDKEAIIKTDTEKFFGILSNLIKNAIKYTNTGKIEFGYNKKEKEFEFWVKDTGIGIPKVKQEAIFERFIQADIVDKMARQGAGLGLAISRAYVEMLGGKIWTESLEGKGSTFYFTLPSTNQLAAETINQKPTPSEKINDVRKLKILIAEDDEVSAMLMDSFIRSFGNDVFKANSGIEAIEACRIHPDIDLILMDIRMPEMSGYEATKQIRKFNNDVVIIAQTAYGLMGDREKSIEAGCNDYIAKPIEKDKLLSLIQKYFKK